MKKIVKQLQLQEQKHGPGFSSAGLRSSTSLDIDPFLNIDFFKMSEPTFRPHPHAGFSAVTYMLPESKGSFQNRDSFGDSSLIHPGDIHWTQAGSGMIHEEVPVLAGVECLGFQFFVNLNSKDKLIPPKAFHAEAQKVPVFKRNGVKIKVVCGQYAGLSSPLTDLATKVNIFDATIEPNSSVKLDLDEEQNWFLFSISGEGLFADNLSIKEREVLHFSKEGTQISLQSEKSRFRFLICSGRKINEPVKWGGPFALTNEEDLEKAFNRFKSGKMGQLDPSF